MKQTLPEYLAEHEDLRQALLAQDGGIVKYLANHLDAEGFDTLFSDYQNYCAEQFYEANKWNLQKVWHGEEMKRVALGETEHLRKELRYSFAVKPLISELSDEASGMINEFIELYLDYAFQKHRRRWHPDGMSPMETYREVIGMYKSGGLADRCMNLILRKHHAMDNVDLTESDLWTEFLIRQWSDNLTSSTFSQMRQAVNNMLMGKTNEQCKQMAIETMEGVRNFSQKIYSDSIVNALREIEFTDEANKRESDGKWLRRVALLSLFEQPVHGRQLSIHYYFAHFVKLLRDIGRIWAAQLLFRGIDMRKLEKQVYSILNPDIEPFYYVDKFFSDEIPGQYYIADMKQAERLLKKTNHKPQTNIYFEVIKEAAEDEIINKLSNAYNILIKEDLLSSATRQETFINVLIHKSDGKIVWLNDPHHSYLMTLINVFRGQSKRYSCSAILKLNKKKGYSVFIKNHFLDEQGNPIDFKTNEHEVNKSEEKKMERILNAIYDEGAWKEINK